MPLTVSREIDGIPAHSNAFLLKKVLRKEWGFRGYVFSDYGGLSQLYNFHHVAATAADAAIMGINAGVDLEASRPDVYAQLVGLVKAGKIKEAQIDSAVVRILTAKFKAGLFEKPVADTANLHQRLHTPEHVMLSQQIAEESIVLLKNEKSLLPLDLNKINSLVFKKQLTFHPTASDNDVTASGRQQAIRRKEIFPGRPPVQPPFSPHASPENSPNWQ